MPLLEITALLALTSATRASVVVNHQPYPHGGLASDTSAIDMFGNPAWQIGADDFQLSSPATIGQVRWWAFYDLDHVPLSETIRIRFYDTGPAGNVPGQLLFEQTFQNPSRAATGGRLPDGNFPHEYLYSAELTSAFVAAGGTRYWLEVAQIGDPATTFRWEFSRTDINGFAAMSNFTPQWHQVGVTSDNAFQLIDVPEPATCCLVGAAAALLGRRRRRPSAM